MDVHTRGDALASFVWWAPRLEGLSTRTVHLQDDWDARYSVQVSVSKNWVVERRRTP